MEPRYGWKYSLSQQKLLAGMMTEVDDRGSWPLEYAERVYLNTRAKDSSIEYRVEALFGSEHQPWAFMRCDAELGARAAGFFLEGDDVSEPQIALSYSWYSVEVSYLPFLRELPRQERERRRGQMFLSHITLQQWNDDLTECELIAYIQMRPDGQATRNDHRGPWGVRGKKPPPFKPLREWAGFDPEICWFQVPEFGDYSELLVADREHLGVFDLTLPKLRERTD